MPRHCSPPTPDRPHAPTSHLSRVRRCAQVKHEVRPFDGERPCHRSVIVQFIRKPVKDGSDKMLIDL
eukprot:scaffold52983_cov74-Phaeocystis_antarctica.AAC.5